MLQAIQPQVSQPRISFPEVRTQSALTYASIRNEAARAYAFVQVLDEEQELRDRAYGDSILYIEELSQEDLRSIGMATEYHTYNRMANPDEDTNLVLEFFAVQGACQTGFSSELLFTTYNQVSSMDLVPA